MRNQLEDRPACRPVFHLTDRVKLSVDFTEQLLQTEKVKNTLRKRLVILGRQRIMSPWHNMVFVF